MLRRIHDEGAALLVVTTRQEVAEALPGRVLYMDDGRFTDRHGRVLDPMASFVEAVGSGPDHGPVASAGSSASTPGS